LRKREAKAKQPFKDNFKILFYVKYFGSFSIKALYTIRYSREKSWNEIK